MRTLSELYQRWLRDRVSLITLVILVISITAFVLTVDRQHFVVRVINVVAAGLVPASLVSIFWDFFARRTFLDYVKAAVGADAKKQSRSTMKAIGARFDGFERLIVTGCMKAGQIWRFGLGGMFRDRDDVNLPRCLAEAQHRIWILVTSFGYLTESAAILNTLQERGNKGVEIRLLGLQPGCESARLRGQFGPFYTNLEKELPIYRKRLQDKLAECIGQKCDIQIGFYDIIPTVACFFIDDTLYFSILLLGERSRNCSHFSVIAPIADTGNQLNEELKRHFEECLGRAQKFEFRDRGWREVPQP